MFKLVVIVEKSKIIRDGIVSILKNHNLAQRIICLETLDEWKCVKDHYPDFVMINSDYLKEGTEKIKSKYHFSENTIFVGIVYLYCPKEIVDAFEEVIYITDTESLILSKLKSLLNVKHSENTANEKLTDREKDVLRLLLQGLSNKEVADKLIISPHTVITHRKNIIEKTNIRSLAGLAVYAIMNNITDMDDIRK